MLSLSYNNDDHQWDMSPGGHSWGYYPSTLSYSEVSILFEDPWEDQAPIDEI